MFEVLKAITINFLVILAITLACALVLWALVSPYMARLFLAGVMFQTAELIAMW